MRWVAEKEFCSEATDFDISAAEGIKEGGVGRGAESTRDVGGEGSIFDACDGWGGGVDGEGHYGRRTGGEDVWGIRGVVGWWGWDVESPHVLADSFRANKNGCRVSQRKDGECDGGEEAGTRGLKEGGNGEERVREGSIRGRPERNRERK